MKIETIQVPAPLLRLTLREHYNLTPEQKVAREEYANERIRLARLKELGGQTLFTGSNIPKKWSRVAYEVRGELAYPQYRQEFWNSVRGNKTPLINHPPVKITFDGRIILVDGEIASKTIIA